MSTGENKPGMRNISDLKARLGMLSKNVGVKPAESGSGTDGPAEVSADTELGMDTQVVRLPSPGPERAEPAPTPTPPPVTPVAPRPSLDVKPPTPAGQAGFSPFALGSASDLFRKPEPTPAPPPRPAAAPAPVAPQAPVAPPPPEPEGLDHPLQVPVYPDEPARSFEPAAPIEYTADDKDFIASVEGVRGVRRRLLVAVCVFMVGLGLVLGFILGNAKIKRQLINAQIDRAVVVRDQILPLLEQYAALVPIIERMDATAVSWDQVEALPVQLPEIQTGTILGGRVPLPEDLMRILGMGVSSLDELFRAARDHRRITLERDRAELEALVSGQSFESNDYFAVLYTPVDPKTRPLDYRPPEGRIVAVVGKPHVNDGGDDILLPIRNRQGKEDQVSLRHVLVMPKEELFSGGSGNALKSYKQRTALLRQMVNDFRSIEPGLREALQKEAARSKVYAF